MASFMPPAYIRSVRGSKARAQNSGGQDLLKFKTCLSSWREERQTGQNSPKMPTTTNRGRAYIRRSRAIQWSSQRGATKASASPLKQDRDDRPFRKGADGACLLRHFPDHRPLTAGGAISGSLGCSIFFANSGF